VNMGFAL